MQLKILYFAVLRDITGLDEESLQVEDPTTPAMMWEGLRRRFPSLAAYRNAPLVAINEAYAAADAQLSDGDVLAFIPPVAGG